MWTDQPVCVSHFFGNFDVSLMVLYSFLENSKSVIGDAKTNMRSSFPYPACLPLVSKFWGLVHGTLWLSEHLQDF